MGNQEDLGMMAQVITMYYVENLSQQEIADKLYFSRSKISRMLQRSKEMNFVEVNIRYPVEREPGLEDALKATYGLRDAVVIKTYSDDHRLMLKRLCGYAAQYVDQRLADGMSLGLSWGTTVYNLVRAAEPKRTKDIEVIQVVGAINGDSNKDYDPIELIRNMAVKYNGSFLPLYAPLNVEDGGVAEALRREPLIARSLERGRKTDMLLTGISYFDESSSVTWERFLTRREKLELLRAGAVGIFFAHFINAQGEVVCPSLDQRVIGIRLEDVREHPSVITVAAGVKKTAATLAALRGGYINVLIIDDLLAKAVLEKQTVK